jgi:ribosomal protein S18 acetylase RimI-like enzyme
MIKIIRTSKKSVRAFNKEAWNRIDFEHFGKKVDWKEHKYRFKALNNKRIIGIISGKFESGVLHIGEIIVDEGERGKGIGKALMQKAEEFGIKMGAHKISLETGSDWKACEFYESLGFKKEADLPNHYFHINFTIYSKYLKS